jgi:hypothetical protein
VQRFPNTIVQQRPSSLSANALDEQNLFAETTRGYSISAMQMLMLVKYQIYMYAEYNQNPVDNIPSYAQYVSPEKVNGVYRKYWIVASTSWASDASRNVHEHRHLGQWRLVRGLLHLR